MQRWDIINHFIKKYNYENYLEIGYYKGWSFDQVECQSKRAVDPNPCKTEEQEKSPYGHTSLEMKRISDNELHGYYILKATSDHFFSEIPEETKWDIIFIDGLHERHQVMRDFNNAKKHLSKGGTIIFHDCNPPLYEHTTTGIDGCWTGDVYKAILQIANTPQYSFYTIDTDWGVGVYRDISVGMAVNHIPSMSHHINNWENFNRDRKEVLKLISVEEFLEREK